MTGTTSKSHPVLAPVIHRDFAEPGNIEHLVRVFVILDDRTTLEHPLGEAVDVLLTREAAERFISEVRGDDAELASHLRIERPQEPGLPGCSLLGASESNEQAKSIGSLRSSQPDLRRVGMMSSHDAVTIQELEETRASWDRIAAGYDRNVTPTHMWLGNEGLRRAQLRSGMRFLDVAAGNGALSIPAARLGAQVMATDLSPAMLEQLAARARKEGLEIETRVMDGHALDLDNDSFDMAGSQFGVMLFPDMPKGISEMVRVVKPDGRVLMNVFGNPHEIEFMGFFVAAIQSVRPDFDGPPADPPPLPFQLQDPETLRRELEVAGLRDVVVETITASLEFETGRELWEWLVSSNPIAEGILGDLGISDDERVVIEQSLERLVRERAGGGESAVLTNPVNIGIGTK